MGFFVVFCFSGDFYWNSWCSVFSVVFERNKSLFFWHNFKMFLFRSMFILSFLFFRLCSRLLYYFPFHLPTFRRNKCFSFDLYVCHCCTVFPFDFLIEKCLSYEQQIGKISATINKFIICPNVFFDFFVY